jgi:3-deoxy-D-manno-octulosonate 8-phosphate phosphatase (KDO 8-P phosphatase)
MSGETTKSDSCGFGDFGLRIAAQPSIRIILEIRNPQSEIRLCLASADTRRVLRTVRPLGPADNPQSTIHNNAMSLLKKFQNIRLFVFDVDGVLTDGSLYVFANGEQVRKMNIKDGYALQLAIKKGYGIMVISGAMSEGVSARLQKLGISDIFMKVVNKREVLIDYLREKNITMEQVLFMGDDIPDYQLMKIAGISCAPADAVADVRSAAHFISTIKGGEGCVREVIEKVLKLNGHWEMETDIPSK